MSMSSVDMINHFWPDWHIVRQLGRGSFGEVFECEKTSEDLFPKQNTSQMGYRSGRNTVTSRSAIKVISIPQHESQLSQLYAEGYDDNSASAYFEKIAEDCIREIKTMERIKHCPNVVYIEDFQVSPKPDGFGWVILIRMELLKSLPDYMKTHQMSEKEILKLGSDLSFALVVCQKKNIIHRDIKPANIMVDENGSYKLADFGIARELDKSETGFSKKGTYSYMAPEIENMDTYDHRVDIYALGIVLYQLLNNNRVPFLDPYAVSVSYEEKMTASVRRIRGESFPPPVNGSASLKNIVMRACSFDPNNRYSTAEQMFSALQSIIKQMPNHDATANAIPVFFQKTDSSKQVVRKEVAQNSGDTDKTAVAKRPAPFIPSGAGNNVAPRSETPVQTGYNADGAYLYGGRKGRSHGVLIGAIAGVLLSCAVIIGILLIRNNANTGSHDNNTSNNAVASTEPASHDSYDSISENESLSQPSESVPTVLQNPVIRLSTTTFVNDSGLLPYLLPEFEAETGYRVEISSSGTAVAIGYAESGDSDLLLLHSQEQEEAFVSEGYSSTGRIPFMYNYYVIVGPVNDPAGIKMFSSAAECFSSIAKSGAGFVSRGDSSGINNKETSIWKSAGIDPTSENWYNSLGMAMGDTLTSANEMYAYTLTDKATFLSMKESLPNLAILKEEAEDLKVTYSLLGVRADAEAFDNSDILINTTGANALIDWLLSDKTAALIAAYGKDRYGVQLYSLIEKE